MYCQKCGFNNSDGSSFCQSCGTHLQQATQAQPVYNQGQQAQPMYGQVQQTYNHQMNNYYAGGNAASSVIKALFSSKIFLIAAITYTCAILFSLISSFTTNSYAMLYNLYSLFDGNYEIQQALSHFLDNYIGAVSGVSIVSTIIQTIPEFLIITALWLIFAAAVNRSSISMGTAGFTIIKVINIINIISIGFAGIVLEIACVIGIIAASQSYYMEGLALVLGILMVVIAAMIAVCIIIYAKVLKTAGAFSIAARMGKPGKKASGFLAVWCIIVAIFQLISIIATVLTGFNIFSILQTLCSAASLLLFGVLIFNYNNEVKAVEASYLYGQKINQY